MPSIPMLASIYVGGMIVLRLLYIAVVNAFGVPNTLASGVILAAAPAAIVSAIAIVKAKETMTVKTWATIWGVLVSIYLIINVIFPAMMVPEFRAVLNDVVGLRTLVMVSAATAAMIALFLWIGTRTVPRGNR